MHIAVHLSNYLMSKAIYELLVDNGYQNVTLGGDTQASQETASVLLVDSGTLYQCFPDQNPRTKFLLVDTGIGPERIIAALLTYKIHGVVSMRTGLDLFKKALKVVSEGQLWIDDQAVKAFLDDVGINSRTGRIIGLTGREREIVAHISRGLSNKEIAQILSLKECTVKSHVKSILRKFKIPRRSRLITLAPVSAKQFVS